MAVAILILLSVIIMSGIYQGWIPRKEKKLTIGVFAAALTYAAHEREDDD